MARKKEKQEPYIYEYVGKHFKVSKICEHCEYAKFYTDTKARCIERIYDNQVRCIDSCSRWKRRKKNGSSRM